MRIDLKDIPTRQLMAWRNQSYKSGYYWYDDNGQIMFSTAQINAELNNREHVPNKKEAKELRRKAAKKKK